MAIPIAPIVAVSAVAGIGNAISKSQQDRRRRQAIRRQISAYNAQYDLAVEQTQKAAFLTMYYTELDSVRTRGSQAVASVEAGTATSGTGVALMADELIALDRSKATQTNNLADTIKQLRTEQSVAIASLNAQDTPSTTLLGEALNIAGGAFQTYATAKQAFN